MKKGSMLWDGVPIALRGLVGVGERDNPVIINKLRLYHDLLVQAAAGLSLVSFKTEEELVERHYLDSLKVVPLIGAYLAEMGTTANKGASPCKGEETPDPHLASPSEGEGTTFSLITKEGVEGGLGQGAKIIDVGSGAGLPGMVVAMFMPAARVTLLEATRKKCDFLQSVVDAISAAENASSFADRVEILCGRAEELGQSATHRELYSIALARAVASLAELVEYTLPFLCVGGVLFAHKGAGVDSELRAADFAVREMGGGEPRIYRYGPPEWADPGTVVEIRKIAPTPVRYPRRPGIPKKRPILG